MSLRLLELVVPQGRDEELDTILADTDVVDRWHLGLEEDRVLVQLLVQQERAESVMDKLEARFRHMEGFRLILLSIDVSIPRILPTEAGESESAAENGEPSFKIGRVSRQELQAQMNTATKGSAEFFVMLVLSAVVAAIGLLANSVAIIIAAMVIAPLLGPNMALALATTCGDSKLARRALRLNLEGIASALGMAIVLGLLIPLGLFPEMIGDKPVFEIPEILSRTRPSSLDFALALAAGCAGTFAFTTGASGALIGVMVAVALMPPTIVLGMTLGAGEWKLAEGAALLLGTNLICVNLAAVLTFAFMGVRPARWWEAKRASQATRRAIAILLVSIAVLIWLFTR